MIVASLISRAHALGVLGLVGTGALHTVHLGGVLRIRRGGAYLHPSRKDCR
jgi:hypothetical protein